MFAHGLVGDTDDRSLKARDCRNERGVGRLRFGESLRPVGLRVWPGEQYSCLRFPFRRQAVHGFRHLAGSAPLGPISVALARVRTLSMTRSRSK